MLAPGCVTQSRYSVDSLLCDMDSMATTLWQCASLARTSSTWVTGCLPSPPCLVCLCSKPPDLLSRERREASGDFETFSGESFRASEDIAIHLAEALKWRRRMSRHRHASRFVVATIPAAWLVAIVTVVRDQHSAALNDRFLKGSSKRHRGACSKMR